MQSRHSRAGIQAEWTLFELAHELRAASRQNHNHNHIQVSQTGHYKILSVGRSQEEGEKSTWSSVDGSRGFAERRVWSGCHFKASTFLLMPGLFGDWYLGCFFFPLTVSFQRIGKLNKKHQSPKRLVKQPPHPSINLKNGSLDARIVKVRVTWFNFYTLKLLKTSHWSKHVRLI